LPWRRDGKGLNQGAHERRASGCPGTRAIGWAQGLDAEKVEAIKTMMANPIAKPAAIARTLGVSRASLYKYSG